MNLSRDLTSVTPTKPFLVCLEELCKSIINGILVLILRCTVACRLFKQLKFGQKNGSQFIFDPTLQLPP